MNQIGFNLISAALGGFVTYAFGEWNELLSLFLMAILVDYVTGIAASMKEQRGLNSQVGYWGLARKGLMLLVIMLAHRMDILMDTDLMMTGAIYFYLANEFISITENYGRLGLPLPSFMKQMIQVLRGKEEGL
ncbi:MULTISPECIES: holin family protein [unclassified Paenibacillus]|uniref:phage holin family protein n=1 Tax=unclassified Paenibacillus TaxID=185978 RepID=UPI0007092E9B|nr:MULTISPECIES: phage holin family protein [unclassified Paenibacillus]KQX52008.1 holin [Paenibacillus sp. Root444D2]KRE50969.1 holin [Paenibacillus sp. Soil724D2]